MGAKAILSGILIAAFLLLHWQPVAASHILSRSARVTLLTCSPGPDLYSVFGHSALRVEDVTDEGRIDEVYNYGTFEFSDGFYLKFVRGQLNYKLSRAGFGDFQQEYLYTGRGIKEQQLMLDSAARQRLYDLLQENYLPANRTYRYDYFYDNCSSRIRDIVQAAGNGKVSFTYVPPVSFTFREAIQRYLNSMPWSDYGIDLVLGIPCDKVMGPGQDMFLPDSLMNEFNFASYGDAVLCSPESEVIPQEFVLTVPRWATPVQVFWLMLLLQVLIWRLFRGKRAINVLDRVIVASTGVAGIVIVFLWFFSDHHAAAWNLNILWANPLNLVLAVWPASRIGSTGRYLIRCYLILLGIFLLSWPLLPQDLHEANIPIVLALGWFLWRFRVSSMQPFTPLAVGSK